MTIHSLAAYLPPLSIDLDQHICVTDKCLPDAQWVEQKGSDHGIVRAVKKEMNWGWAQQDVVKTFDIDFFALARNPQAFKEAFDTNKGVSLLMRTYAYQQSKDEGTYFQIIPIRKGLAEKLAEEQKKTVEELSSRFQVFANKTSVNLGTVPENETVEQSIKRIQTCITKVLAAAGKTDVAGLRERAIVEYKNLEQSLVAWKKNEWATIYHMRLLDLPPNTQDEVLGNGQVEREILQAIRQAEACIGESAQDVAGDLTGVAARLDNLFAVTSQGDSLVDKLDRFKPAVLFRNLATFEKTIGSCKSLAKTEQIRIANEILSKSEQSFIEFTLCSSLATQKAVLELLDLPSFIRADSSSGRLVAAIKAADPELVRLWRTTSDGNSLSVGDSMKFDEYQRSDRKEVSLFENLAAFGKAIGSHKDLLKTEKIKISTGMLATSEKSFTEFTLQSSLATQKAVLELLDLPSFVRSDSPSGRLVAALRVADPELIRLWRATSNGYSLSVGDSMKFDQYQGSNVN